MDGIDATAKPSPPRDDQNMFEATPPLRRSGRKIQLPGRYRENSCLDNLMSLNCQS